MTEGLPNTLEASTILIFAVTVIICLIIDLMCHHDDREVSFRSACLWSVFWVFVSVCFGGFLYWHFNSDVASLFFSGYVLEKSLSVDNLFAIMAIFTWFKIPRGMRHRVLYYGILGAIFFRAMFVGVGTFLLSFGSGVEILFGLFVLYTAYVMFKEGGDDDDEIEDYSTHKAYRFTRSLFPMWPKLEGHSFFLGKKTVEELKARPENQSLTLKRSGLIYATPLFLCLGVVELSDVSFSFDSVPAVIAVSKEPLIIYSAMIFAILGLRSLYFVLESLTKFLCHLEKAVIFLLVFIGFKLIYNAACGLAERPDLELSNVISMIVIVVTLGAGILASVIFPEKKEEKAGEAGEEGRNDGKEEAVAGSGEDAAQVSEGAKVSENK